MDERIRVLELIRDKKVTPEEGLELLRALDDSGLDRGGVLDSLVDLHSEEEGPAKSLKITSFSKSNNKSFSFSVPLSVIKFVNSIFPNALVININNKYLDRGQFLEMIQQGEKGIIFREDSGKEQVTVELS